MDTYEVECMTPWMLNQQIASVVFSCLPEDGPLAVILDGHGQYWPSDAAKYSAMFSQSHSLEGIIARIDDGADPVIGDIDGTAIVASELVTKNGHCGYVVIALDGYTQESAVENIDLVDTILSLMSLVGGLIEKANQMQAVQMKNLNYSRYSEPCFN
ncbi:MAG: hypothetical protein FVQ82_00335 [Planctomycetes bacterium]|nr:hypothetical protein [Planctomycetota bacterium]